MAPKLNVRLWMDADTYEKQVEFVADRVGRIGSRTADFGKALTLAITAPLTLIAAPAIAAAQASHAAEVQIRAGLGASGAALDAAMAMYSEVRGLTGASVDDVAGAIVELGRGLGLSGEGLQSAVTSLINVAQASKTAIIPAAQAVSQVMRAWSIDGSQVGATAETLRAAARGVDGGFTTVAGMLASAGPVFRAAGLSFDQAAQVLTDLARSGVPVEDALGGLTKAVAVLSASGVPSVSAALAGIFEAIRNAPSAGEAAAASMELFGTKTVAMVDAIRSGGLAFGALAAGAGRLNPPSQPVLTLTRALSILFARMTEALVPLGKAITPIILSCLKALSPLVEIARLATAAFASLPDGLKAGIIGVLALAAIAGPAILAFGAIASGFAALVGVAVGTVGITGSVTAIVAAVVVSGVMGASTAAAGLTRAAAPVAAISAQQGITGVSSSASNAASSTGQAAAAVGASGAAAYTEASAAAAKSSPVFPPPPTLRAIPTASIPNVAINVSATVQAPPPIPVGKVAGAMDGSTAGYNWQGAVGDWQKNFQAAAAGGSMPSAQIPPVPQYAGPSAGQSIGDAMRAHAARMADWYGRMRELMLLPPQPWMPGSWLDANQSSAWLARAADADRMTRDTQDRDSFWIAKWEENQRLAKQEYDTQNFAKSMAFRSPVIVTESDIFATLGEGMFQVEDNGFGSPGALPEAANKPPPASPADLSAAGVGTAAIPNRTNIDELTQTPVLAERSREMRGPGEVGDTAGGGASDPRLADAEYMARLSERGLTLNDVRPGDYADWTNPNENGGKARSAEAQRWLDVFEPSQQRGVHNLPAVASGGASDPTDTFFTSVANIDPTRPADRTEMQIWRTGRTGAHGISEYRDAAGNIAVLTDEELDRRPGDTAGGGA